MRSPTSVHLAELTDWRFGWSFLRGRRLRILMYHSISANPADPYAIPPDAFRRQMEHLRESGRQVVSLEEGLRCLQESSKVTRPVVLSFDDACRDFLTSALPVL